MILPVTVYPVENETSGCGPLAHTQAEGHLKGWKGGSNRSVRCSNRGRSLGDPGA